MSDASNRLSRERIVAAALALVDREGWEVLSMRRLAQELDVWPMAVYRHFRDKEELIAALATAMAERVEPAYVSGGWRERLVALLSDLNEALASEADLPPTVRKALLDAPAATAATTGVEILRDAGLDSDEAARVWRALASHGIAASSAPGDELLGIELMLDGIEARITS
jgi:TetR/AcrR family transcriptional regulator, tetracycline repressor protein